MNHRSHPVYRRSTRYSVLFFVIFSLLMVGLPATASAAQDATTPSPVAMPLNQDDDAAGDEETSDEEASDDEPQPVDTLEDAQSAVIQIEAIGTFLDPSEGLQLNAAGAGSGFIISPDGIAVTNNHVVTGAAFLKVYIAGEDRPRNARVLGVSECADLAVIDIEGEGYPFLDWYDERIRVGLDVYAAGFPLGDPEYTLTRGIVSKANADGDSNWASVSNVLQHDATINPGNSGGPLITRDGAVVGVNYAGDRETSQYFAISRDEVLPLLEEMRQGNDVDAIGINGQALFLTEDQGGIWVASVESGTPADNAGIRPGDILLSMENLLLAQDGTMADYCNILRSRAELDDIMRVKVLRTSTGNLLTGQLNGRPLEVSFVYDQLEASQEADAGASAGSDAGNNDGEEADAPEPATVADYDRYVTVTDESELISLEIPEKWSDVSAANWIRGEEETVVGQAISAAGNLDDYYETWDEPGFFLGVSDVLVEEFETVGDYLDGYDYANACEDFERSDYAYGVYTGAYNYWSGCGSNGSTYVNIAMTPETNEFLVVLSIQMVSEADFTALDHMLGSLSISRPQPESTAAETERVDTSGLIYDYETFSLDYFSVLAPDTWTDSAEEPWEDDGDTLGQIVRIAEDLDDYAASWLASGMIVYLTPELAAYASPEDVLDLSTYDACDYGERTAYEQIVDGTTYSGSYDIWTDCGGTDTAVFVLAASSELLDNMVLIELQAANEADVEAFSVAIRSLGLGDRSSATTDAGADTSATPAYTSLKDTWDLLTVTVPEEWTDVRHELWVIDETPYGVQTWASTDIDGFQTEWRTPGMVYRATVQESITAEELLDLFDYTESCTYGDRFNYEDPVFEGVYDIWYECGGLDTLATVLVSALKSDPDTKVMIQIQVPAAQNEAVFDLITESFNLNPAIDIPELVDDLWADSDGTESAGSGQPSSTAPENSDPVAVVLASALNVRSGPGTGYGRVGMVSAGDRLRITAQVNNCGWLGVRTPDGSTGWVSGNSQYVRFNVACREIPAVDADFQSSAPPAGNSGSNAGNNTGSNTGNNSGSNSASSPSATQGCYVFQNNLNTELTITFTAQGRDWNNTFKIGAGAERQECFDPGSYTYTLDAPPPWGSTNGSLDIAAGDYYNFPINPQ